VTLLDGVGTFEATANSSGYYVFKLNIDQYQLFSEDIWVGETMQPLVEEALEIQDIKVANITAHSATVSFITNRDAETKLEYGKTLDYKQDAMSEGYHTVHSFRLEGLTANTDYYFRITAEDHSGNLAVSTDQTFLTMMETLFLSELPITAVPPKWYEHLIMTVVAEYVVPVASFVVLLLQFLNLLAKLGGLPNIISRARMLFGAVFDEKRKKRGWGIVYDMYKKLPIPFAIVRIYDVTTRGLVEETVTDLDGRYRFLVREGVYTLGVSHPDYVFPKAEGTFAKSRQLIGKYLGGEVKVQDGLTIGYDVPMISNARAMHGARYYNTKESFKLVMDKLGRWVNFVGGILLILSIVISPAAINYVLFGVNVFVIAIVLAIRSAQPKSWGKVYDNQTLAHVQGVFVRLFDANENKLINTQISNADGRYGFLVDEGNYLLTAAIAGYEMENVRGKTIVSKAQGKAIKLAFKEGGVINQDLP